MNRTSPRDILQLWTISLRPTPKRCQCPPCWPTLQNTWHSYWPCKLGLNKSNKDNYNPKLIPLTHSSRCYKKYSSKSPKKKSKHAGSTSRNKGKESSDSDSS